MSKLEQARHPFEKALSVFADEAAPFPTVDTNAMVFLFTKDKPLEDFLWAGATKLWRALNHPDTLANLSFVSKSYGGGALKTEPRQLDQLEIPQSVLDEVGLNSLKPISQPMLLDKVHRRKKRSASRNRKP